VHLGRLLEQGRIVGNDFPESRFNLKSHFDGSRRPKTMRSPEGMFLENVDPEDFDESFFGVSGAGAIAMDPQQRQLLEVVYECLEHAGITMETIDEAPIGCFVGPYTVGMTNFNSQPEPIGSAIINILTDYADIQTRDPEDHIPSVTIGVGRALLSNRVRHFFNITSPR
jgi:acyl transferase domain-containing protein